MSDEDRRGQPRRQRYRSPSYSHDSRDRHSRKRSRSHQHDGDRRRYNKSLRRSSTSSNDAVRERRQPSNREYGRKPRRRSLSPEARYQRPHSRSLDSPSRHHDKPDNRRHERSEGTSRHSPMVEDSFRPREHKHHGESTERPRQPRRTSDSPPRVVHRRHSRSRSPKRRKTSPGSSAAPARRTTAPLPTQADSYNRSSGKSKDTPDNPVGKQKPNYSTTGALARETNTVAGTKIVLKYNEPPDSRKPPPSQPWRLYIFKPSQSGDPILPPIPLHTRTTWLLGCETAVADLPIEHPSCSKQHAVIQFRHTTKVNEYGDKDARVRPYVIDLGSANGTVLNGEEVQKERFVELRDGDVLKFGESEREYVIMLPPADT